MDFIGCLICIGMSFTYTIDTIYIELLSGRDI